MRAAGWRRTAPGLVVLAALAAWAVRAADPGELGRALASARPGWLAWAAAANAGALWLQAMRWRALLAPVAPVRRRDAFAGLAVGFGLSALLPARLGEVVRVGWVASRTGLSAAAVAGTLLLDHVVNGLALVPLLLALSTRGGLPAWAREGAAALVVAAAAAAALAFAWARRDVGAGQGPAVAVRARLRARLAEGRAGLLAIRTAGPLARALALGLFAWGAEAGTAWLALRAFGIDRPWEAVLVVLVAVNLSLAVPAAPGNVGTFEAGAVLALAGLGVGTEAALAFALGYHAVQLLSVGAVALAAWPVVRRGRAAARERRGTASW